MQTSIVDSKPLFPQLSEEDAPFWNSNRHKLFPVQVKLRCGASGGGEYWAESPGLLLL
jgi:hypothetical protein